MLEWYTGSKNEIRIRVLTHRCSSLVNQHECGAAMTSKGDRRQDNIPAYLHNQNCSSTEIRNVPILSLPVTYSV